MKHNFEDGKEVDLITFFRMFPEGATNDQVLAWHQTQKRAKQKAVEMISTQLFAAVGIYGG
jgi:hypothetical protein